LHHAVDMRAASRTATSDDLHRQRNDQAGIGVAQTIRPLGAFTRTGGVA
jgi:hypothetical protein